MTSHGLVIGVPIDMPFSSSFRILSQPEIENHHGFHLLLEEFVVLDHALSDCQTQLEHIDVNLKVVNAQQHTLPSSAMLTSGSPVCYASFHPRCFACVAFDLTQSFSDIDQILPKQAKPVIHCQLCRIRVGEESKLQACIACHRRVCRQCRSGGTVAICIDCRPRRNDDQEVIGLNERPDGGGPPDLTGSLALSRHVGQDSAIGLKDSPHFCGPSVAIDNTPVLWRPQSAILPGVSSYLCPIV